jgi:hypothetical protein
LKLLALPFRHTLEAARENHPKAARGCEDLKHKVSVMFSSLIYIGYHNNKISLLFFPQNSLEKGTD